MSASKKTFLSAQWRKLIIANYIVDAQVLQEFVPEKTELDLWNGKCYVSLVGFMFLDTKVKGCKIPYHINFEEVNLRFYVKHFDGKQWKRGVVFIKEIVPKMMITFVANKFYGEHYETMRMRHNHQLCSKSHELYISYFWKKKDWYSIEVVADENRLPIGIGSEEEFITEHYWGYTQLANGQTSEYEVAHPRWEVYPVKSYEIKADFETIYGRPFGILNQIAPVSVILAEGSEISVMQGKCL